MKRAAIVSLTIAVCLGHAVLASGQVPCVLSGFSPLQLDTGIAVSPRIYDAALQYPVFGPAIAAARDAWNETNARRRLGNYNGLNTGAECPAGQPPFRISAFNFHSEFCETVETYNDPRVNSNRNTKDFLAFVDYFSPQLLASVGVFCPHCGTKSMSINLMYTFSLEPLPGQNPMQFDIQSIMTHEFGHMLGLRHMDGGLCAEERPVEPPRCSQNPSRNTMATVIRDGDTCQRDPTEVDKSNANSVYSPPPALMADVVVYRPGSGEWLIRRSFDGGLTQVDWGCWWSCGDKPVAVDYDGDGFSDIAVYRSTTGEWFIQRSSDGGLTQVNWGCASCGDIPVPGDYDGDHRADIAIYRPGTAEWYILRSSDGGFTVITWGCPTCGDIPVPADYDGDGRIDIAVYRSTTGQWFIRRSSDGGVTQINWGCWWSCGDIPVPADYDGDGRADVGVFRSSTGEWYILRTSDNGLTHVNWGCGGCADIPVAADYDGDGRADVAVYRPGTAEWYMLRSSEGYNGSLVWNTPGQQDQPVKFLKR